MDNIESMEEDKLISLSATPPFENTSPEELRWEGYQAKKIDAFQMTLNVGTGSFSMPNMVKIGGAALNYDVSTPNAVGNSAPAWKFFNIGGSVTSTTISSPQSSSWSSKSIPSPSCPMLGLPSTSASVLGLPSTPAPMLGFPSISSSCAELKFNDCLEWPQQSVQMSALSLPSPITTITPSSSGTVVDQNLSTQRPLASETPANTFAVPSSSSFTLSNVEGSSSVMRGISSLPDSSKCCQARSISLLTSKQVFQKTVIRMQTRRHGSLKKDGPRVSFLNEYSDPDYSRNLDASLVTRENPKASLLHTPWLENGGTQNGTQKDDSIIIM